MAFLDVEALLAPVSPDAPCGQDLEYDTAFGEMDRAARGKPAQQMGDNVVPAQDPDWRAVARIGKELCKRTKDLRVGVKLAQAGVRLEGVAGLRDGLALVRGLLERHWDGVFPKLDPDDGNDPTMRVNAITAFVDRDAFLRPVRAAKLVSSKVLGSFSLRDVQLAGGAPAEAGDAPPTAEPGALPPDLKVIDAAFQDCPLEELQGTAAAVEQSLEAVKAIDQLLDTKIGASQAPNLDALPAVLNEIRAFLAERIQRRGGVAPGAPAAGAASAAAPGQAAVPGTIATREDAIRMMDRICDFFARHEPSSPVPILLQRAKRLVAKDFMAILQDMAPDGVDQFKVFRGVDTADE